MKAISILCSIALFSYKSFCQSCHCEIPVFHPNVVALQKFEAPDTIVIYRSAQLIEKYFIKDCFGTMAFTRTNSIGQILMRGNLTGTDKLTKQKVDIVDLEGNKIKTKVIKRYVPKKSGDWLYYNDQWNLIKRETYENDSLLSTINY